MDLIYLDLNSKISIENLASFDLLMFQAASLFFSPFRVLGLSYQLSSSTPQSSIGDGLKRIRAWNNKSYKFKTHAKLNPHKFLKIPVFKNYWELISFTIENKKFKCLFAGAFWESFVLWGSFRVKLDLIALINKKTEYKVNPYFNIFGYSVLFTVIDCWFKLLESLTTKITYEYYNYGQNKLKSYNSKFLGYFVNLSFDYKDIKSSFFEPSYSSVYYTKLICYFYANLALYKEWTTEKYYDVYIMHTICYPLQAAQKRLEAQNWHPALQPFRYKNILHALINIYKKEGILDGLYRGFLFNTFCTIPRYLVIPWLLYAQSLENQFIFDQKLQESADQKA